MKRSRPHVDPEGIITLFYPAGSLARERLLRHGELVARKALDILDQASWLDADREFVVQAAMLHDIGIGRTRYPELGCTGTLPYVCHGVEGRVILDEMDLNRHAMVCERHVGVGISAEEAIRRQLPLPARDMVPLSIEERLICYADKFFSKNPVNAGREKAPARILAGLARYGDAHAEKFRDWMRLFREEESGPGH